MAIRNPHTGSRFDDLLRDEGIYEDVQVRALKRALAERLEEGNGDAACPVGMKVDIKAKRPQKRVP